MVHCAALTQLFFLAQGLKQDGSLWFTLKLDNLPRCLLWRAPRLQGLVYVSTAYKLSCNLTGPRVLLIAGRIVSLKNFSPKDPNGFRR